jgi:hypothetical protein
MTNAKPHAVTMRELRNRLDVKPSRKRISADAHVAWSCAVAIAFFFGATLGERLREPSPICRTALPDGRRLMEYAITSGQCIYETSKPKKWSPL